MLITAVFFGNGLPTWQAIDRFELRFVSSCNFKSELAERTEEFSYWELASFKLVPPDFILLRFLLYSRSDLSPSSIAGNLKLPLACL